MGEDQDRKEGARPEGGASTLPKEVQSPTGVPWTKPGHIAEPREKDWDAEPADPYEGVERKDPFEGRPASAVPKGADSPVEPVDPGIGQPLPPKKDE
jgi:hypothetical protein